mmetsp:Transcript_37187/g.79328  ORF Transcript_37187/g.79328 Transcript_37187/m.79328 type:complete len:405 (+) Transcript_37187:327-1541(+)
MKTFHLSNNCLLGSSELGARGLLVVKFTDGKGGQSLHETGSVVGSRRVGEGEHGLGDLTVELGVGVSEVGLNIHKLLDVVEGSIHGDNGDIASEVLFLGVGEFHSRGRGRELIGGWSPGDVRPLVEEVGGVEVGDSLLLDGTDLEGLLVLGVEVSREDLDDVVGELLLGLNVGVEIGLACLDGGHDGLQGVSALLHVTLDLPVELDIRRDVEVKAEVDELTDALVNEGVEALDDDDGGGFDLLGRVEGSVDVVVDGLHDRLSVLERLNVLVHEIELLLGRVEGGEAGDLASLAVVEMVVVEADDGGHVGDEGVGLPPVLRAEATAEGSTLISAEGGGHATHEGGLSTAGVGGKADDDGSLAILQGVKGRGGGGGAEGGRAERRGGEGRGGGGREGNDGHGELHG